MRRLAIFLLFVGSLTAAIAQQDGGTSEVLQSIYIPPLHDAPFTAIVHTEWVRPFAGGGSSTLVNQRRIVRDRDGRIYQERWLLVPKNGKIESQMNLIQIYDPNEHTGYDCFMLGRQKGYCELNTYAGQVRRDAVQPSGPLPNNAGNRTHEDLGTRVIDGVET